MNISKILNIRKIRYDLIYMLTISQLTCHRNPISHVKERSEISKSTRKIYKQKGTGKARHGSLKANIFRGGGITFGPNKYKTYNIKINKRIKKSALKSAISIKYKKNLIFIYKDLTIENNKYKTFKKTFGSFFDKNIKILIINHKKESKSFQATKNNHVIKYIDIFKINVLDIMKHKFLCFTEEAFKKLLKLLI